MVKIFVQSVTTTSVNTIQRDLRSLEDQVNDFVKNPQVLPQSSILQQFFVGGTQFLTILLDYNIKQGG